MRETTAAAIIISTFLAVIALCTASDNWKDVEIARAEAQSCQKQSSNKQ